MDFKIKKFIENCKLKIENSRRRQGGFTLIEIVIAVFILTVGTVTSVNLITRGVQVVGIVKNDVIAANLAQEGIEVVRGLRDSNWIQDGAWGEWYSTSTQSGWCVDYDSTSMSQCNGDIFWDGGSYVHESSGNDDTPFNREIIIEEDTDSDGADFVRVQSVVNWDGRGRTAETHLYDWR